MQNILNYGDFMKSLHLPNFRFNISFLNKLRTSTSIGIQYSESFLKIAFLEKKGDELHIPLTPFQIDIYSSDEEETGLLLKEEIERRKEKVNSVVVGLPANAVLFRTLKLPKMKEDQLKDTIEYNIKEDIKNIKGSTIYDYSVLFEDSDGLLNILVVIAKLNPVEKMSKILDIAGLKLDIVDTNVTALINLAFLLQEKKEEKEENICIIHLDDDESFIIFFHKTLIIQNLNFNSIKYESLDPDEKENVVEGLINEINYFFLTIHEPKNIYLSGNAFKFPEIKAYSQLKFADRFNLEDLDPVIALNLKYEGNTHLGIYNVPLSLAYRGFIK
jgi:type IV pilus assembly protein PilM